ncbi:hypothetical protein BT96DRAFT_1026309 [Gymnopus androsaceus JB14]|uniref:Uncharacterized protein n=1 Tax=Gymnopus androsaceus JB14 TaxID=1447944 RepID=A0A6A4GM26_9AGAR|nr:hypothetical protein BT96DRAFT_1026309 [Gymnopus androsaceus JB14]
MDYTNQSRLNPDSSPSFNAGNFQQNSSMTPYPYSGESIFTSNRASTSSQYRQEALLRAQQNSIAYGIVQNHFPQSLPVYQLPNFRQQHDNNLYALQYPSMQLLPRPLPQPRYPALLFSKLERDESSPPEPTGLQSRIAAPVPQPYEARSKEILTSLVSSAENKPQNATPVAFTRQQGSSQHQSLQINSKEENQESVQSWLESQEEFGQVDSSAAQSQPQSRVLTPTAVGIGDTNHVGELEGMSKNTANTDSESSQKPTDPSNITSYDDCVDRTDTHGLVF